MHVAKPETPPQKVDENNSTLPRKVNYNHQNPLNLQQPVTPHIEDIYQTIDHHQKTINHRFEDMNQKIDHHQKTINHRFSDVDQQIADLHKKMDNTFALLFSALSSANLISPFPSLQIKPDSESPTSVQPSEMPLVSTSATVV